MSALVNQISNNETLKIIGRRLVKILTKQKAVVAILLMLLIMVIFARDTRFFTWPSFMDIFRQTSHIWIIAFGVTFVVICKACDLSVGSVMALSGIIVVLLINSGMNMMLAITIAILSGSVIGFINGFLVVQQKTEAFIITLGMGMLVKGIGLFLLDGLKVSVSLQIDPEMRFLNIAGGNTFGMPNIVWFMLLMGVIAFVLLRFTSFGRNCYALGGDYEVAEHSGINVLRTKWVAFVLSGTYAAMAGVLLASRFNSCDANFGDEIPLLTNCSVVIGGTSFAGGVGGPIHSFLGVMVVQLLVNCMLVLGIDFFLRNLILGLTIVTIIALDCYAIKRKKEDV